jgi:hypothetical protein
MSAALPLDSNCRYSSLASRPALPPDRIVFSPLYARLTEYLYAQAGANLLEETPETTFQLGLRFLDSIRNAKDKT